MRFKDGDGISITNFGERVSVMESKIYIVGMVHPTTQYAEYKIPTLDSILSDYCLEGL